MTHKLRMWIPLTIQEALQIDARMGTTFCKDAINKEIARVKIDWIAKEENTPDDVKQEMNFSRKANFVTGRHTTDVPDAMMYASIVSRDSIHMAFLIAGLNNMDVMSFNFLNACMDAKYKEKI
eukprot:2481707-Ditylum_brightwellii.AAC.1